MSDRPGRIHPMRSFRRRGLILQMFSLIVLPLTVLVLAISIIGLRLHREAMRTLVGARDERAARAAASALTEQLKHRASAVQSLALRAAPQYSGASPEDILYSADHLLPDFDGGLALFSRTGDLLASKGGSDLWGKLASSPDSTLQALLARDNPPTFSLITDPVGGGPLVLVAANAAKGGPIALGAFSPESLARQALAGAIGSNEQTAAFIVTPEGLVLFQGRDSQPEGSLATHPGVAEALRGESGATYFPVDNGEHVVAFSPIAPTGWALVIEEPWDAVASPLLRTTEAAPLVMVPVLVLATVALWLGIRQVVRPLQALEARAARLAWGDYPAIEEPVGGIEEITHLQSTLIYLANRVRAAQNSLRSYIGAITTGQEEERRRLARELHDDTLQSLIALNQRVHLARLEIDGSPASQALDEIHSMTGQTIEDLRRITRALRPLYLEDLGLLAALDMLVRETAQAYSTPISFHRQGAEQRLSSTEELTLYRMAQEALSNVVRHSSARQASLTIQFTPDSVTLVVVDDGQGFEMPESPAEFAPHGHFGLLGLYERAELIGARLRIDSKPGQGAKLTIALPIAHEASKSDIQENPS